MFFFIVESFFPDPHNQAWWVFPAAQSFIWGWRADCVRSWFLRGIIKTVYSALTSSAIGWHHVGIPHIGLITLYIGHASSVRDVYATLENVQPEHRTFTLSWNVIYLEIEDDLWCLRKAGSLHKTLYRFKEKLYKVNSKEPHWGGWTHTGSYLELLIFPLEFIQTLVWDGSYVWIRNRKFHFVTLELSINPETNM